MSAPTLSGGLLGPPSFPCFVLQAVPEVCRGDRCATERGCFKLGESASMHPSCFPAGGRPVRRRESAASRRLAGRNVKPARRGREGCPERDCPAPVDPSVSLFPAPTQPLGWGSLGCPRSCYQIPVTQRRRGLLVQDWGTSLLCSREEPNTATVLCGGSRFSCCPLCGFWGGGGYAARASGGALGTVTLSSMLLHS